jgi:fatty-acyl-CoA synthase
MRFPLWTPGESVRAVRAILGSGLVRLYRPDHLARLGLAALRYGFGAGFGPLIGATSYPDAPALVDESGPVGMRPLEERCSAVAHGLAGAGLREGDAVGVLARNCGEFYLAMVAASRLGADVIYLNTGFAAGQVASVAAEHELRALVYDPEFANRLPEGVLAIPTTDGEATARSVRAMALGRSPSVPWPARTSRHVILTSGTTGSPKAVPRTSAGFESAVALLAGLPYRARETHLVAAPMFHAWGWLNVLLTMLLSSTVVLTRRFDPELVLARVEQQRCHVLVAVPTMLQRIMDLPTATRRRYDSSSLRVVAVSGSALSDRLARAFMDEYGDILYSLYGSTEAAFASVAGPADLRAAPGTAGRPLCGIQVRILDPDGRPCRRGVPGAIHVDGREVVAERGTARTGDIGWFDRDGRLFVAGREDDMLIVGGENVYPIVVERALEEHPDIVEAAVTGRPDRVLGQVPVAHVVLREAAATTTGLQAWCRRRLAAFQVPRRIVVHARLPRNETGKVVKKALEDND